ncbi:condensation domain-containing protein [Dactylosporangium sp. NPDC049742]|uniref:condensation domain-containing protein n=1 Tax=Dactylosporangium sp. NPDC049742 TaxID=3154737 RepID=UPI0034222452
MTHVVMSYCHLAVDGLGIDAIVRDMANLDAATGEAVARVGGITPFELAGQQASAAGRRAGDKSLRHWERVLRALPPRRLGTSDDPCTPRYRELALRSPALRRALPRIAARTGIGTGYILLAAYAMALHRLTGRNPSVAQLVVSNRFRPGCADSVSHLAQLSVCAVVVTVAADTHRLSPTQIEALAREIERIPLRSAAAAG